MGELELSPEAAKLLAARKAAIAELHALDGKERGVGDHDVIRLSGARMMVEALTMRMLGGDAVGPSDLRQANAMVDEALSASGTKLPTIRLTFCKTVTGICPKCNARIDDYHAATPSAPPPTIDAVCRHPSNKRITDHGYPGKHGPVFERPSS
jgi:hypothetical protein